MMKFGVTLVRHGETRYNKAKILQGQGVDEPLSQFGFKQAEAAGKFLSNIKFTHVFSSDLQRAKQTASAIVLKNSYGSKLKIICDTRLRERKYGIVEGKPLNELRAMAKSAGQKCPFFTPPGAETVAEVQARAEDFFNYLCQLLMENTEKGNGAPDQFEAVADYSGGLHISLKNPSCVDFNSSDINDDNSGTPVDLMANVLVVSHGGFIRQWVRYFVEDLKCLLPQSFDESKAFSVCPNTAVSSFIITFNQVASSSPGIMCDYLYKCSHIDDISL
ncbi:fructose-2,6-bisphosphatase TIGAR-like isoform X2 [Pristis pectinata]|uniref:fructose-2,6-bisphosphatase TIGAR-like isoform X2 n=1 Tax=Pristis pectinata TaxID=685728 RepID=UPI00223E5FA9|nr:fructose-2,6-bisphosphatase TIGAR-like isoform X2 [Pristis pectinata]